MRRRIIQNDGSIAVEFALVGTVMIMITIALIEAMLGFWQWNTAQRAAKTGARLASVSAPISSDLLTANFGTTGQVVSNYTRVCDGATQSCSNGTYSAAAMNRLVFGADGSCGPENQLQRRGICDIYRPITAANVVVTYSASVNEIAGAPGGLQPIVTVTLKDMDLNFAILPMVGSLFDTLPNTSASLIGQDLSDG